MTDSISGSAPVEKLIEMAIAAARRGDMNIPSYDGIEDSEVLREIDRKNVGEIEWVDNGYVVHGTGNTREMVERVPATRDHPREDVFTNREFEFTIGVRLDPHYSPPRVRAETTVEFI